MNLSFRSVYILHYEIEDPITIRRSKFRLTTNPGPGVLPLYTVIHNVEHCDFIFSYCIYNTIFLQMVQTICGQLYNKELPVHLHPVCLLLLFRMRLHSFHRHQCFHHQHTVRVVLMQLQLKPLRSVPG